MDAVDDARPREEGAEDRERERRHQEREVPDPQHPPTLLDEHRVDVRRSGEPRQQARVLDRIPGPHTAPPEHLVAPPATEEDADREETPGEEGPAAGLEEPALPHPAGHERRDREGEGHREPDISEVEDRRVEQDEDVVLQERVRPRPIEAHRHGRSGGERRGRPERDEREERRDHVHDHEGPGDERVVAARPESEGDRGGEDHQDEDPQQDRAFEGAPHRGHVVEGRRGGGTDLLDELDRVVALGERDLHHRDREHGAEEGRPGEEVGLGDRPTVPADERHGA